MAIAASGAVSFSDLRTEFVGGSSAISLGDLYRGGSNILSKAGDNPAVNLAASVPASGAIDIGDFHSTAKGFKSTVSSSTTNVDANALFGDDYDVNYPKIIDINSGVTLGGVSDEALDIPSGLAGTLVINNAGNIYGYGGAAGGGAGGNAINCATANVTINNTGEIRGGGGGGGAGGTGGNGSYVTTSYSGTRGQHDWTCYSAGCFVHYAGGYRCHNSGYNMMPTSQTSCVYAGTTLRKGNFFVEVFGWNHYQLGVDSNNATSGGSGGAGGVGQGYNVTNASGSSGAAGGTNAGTGGAGGAGSVWATAGSAGSTGANGNASNGSGGSSGGAAGAAVAGTSITMNNTGTISGTVA